VDAVMEEGGAVAFALGSVTWDWETAVKDGPNYVPVAALLPAGRSAFAVVESKLELGFRTFKWKVGVADVRDELAMLDDLLALLPEGARLRLDANGVWDRRTAERWLNGAAERPGIEYVEQPTSPNNRDLLLGLAEDHPVTLALDEAVRGRSDFQLWRDLGWPGVYVLKPALWGAPDDLLTEVRGSEDDVVISSALETVVGARVVLAMGFALGTGQRALGVGVWPLFAGDGHEGPTAMPFIRQEEVLALSMERVETRCQGGRT
jgi:O-succinylbenzoate synthase